MYSLNDKNSFFISHFSRDFDTSYKYSWKYLQIKNNTIYLDACVHRKCVLTKYNMLVHDNIHVYKR